MLYIITEDSNSARDFWEYAASVYRNKGTYMMVPLPRGTGGNTTLKSQINKVFGVIQPNDELFLVLDNIGSTKRFNSYDIIINTARRCQILGIRFTYTKYYCFEELYLSYSEVLKLTNSKYIDTLRYVHGCINNGTEYFDLCNMDTRVNRFINELKHNIVNKEHFANELLMNVTHFINGKFKISNSGNTFNIKGKCWIHNCINIKKCNEQIRNRINMQQ